MRHSGCGMSRMRAVLVAVAVGLVWGVVGRGFRADGLI